jgi:Kef-type K+ transport system membrane component KefB
MNMHKSSAVLCIPPFFVFVFVFHLSQLDWPTTLALSTLLTLTTAAAVAIIVVHKRRGGAALTLHQ